MKLLNKPNDKNHIVYEQEIREDILKQATEYRTTEYRPRWQLILKNEEKTIEYWRVLGRSSFETQVQVMTDLFVCKEK